MQWSYSSDRTIFKGRILSCIHCNFNPVCAHCFVPVSLIESSSNAFHHEECPFCSDVSRQRNHTKDPRIILNSAYKRILRNRGLSATNIIADELTEISTRFYTSDCGIMLSDTPESTPPISRNPTPVPSSNFLESSEIERERFPLPSIEEMGPHLLDAFTRHPITVLLLGLTGAGKSSTGCFLSDDGNAFSTGRSLESVTTELATKEYTYSFKSPIQNCGANVNRPYLKTSPSSVTSQRFLLIDCPGFMDTRGESITEEALEKLALVSPGGIDSIVVVVDGSQRFGEEAAASLNMVEQILGANCRDEQDGSMWDRVVFVFTREIGKDVSKRLVDLPEVHPLRIAVGKSKWRVWKTENHHWRAFKHADHPGEITCPPELFGVLPPNHWSEDAAEDREIIHQMIYSARSKVAGPLDPDVCRAVRKARESVGLEYNAMLENYAQEVRELEKRRRRGEITSQDYRQRLLDMQNCLSDRRKQMAKLEVEGMRKALETKHDLLRFAGKTSMVLLGAAGIAAASIAAAGAMTAAAPTVAAGGVGAWLWSRSRASSVISVADVAMAVGKRALRSSISSWMNRTSHTLTNEEKEDPSINSDKKIKLQEASTETEDDAVQTDD